MLKPAPARRVDAVKFGLGGEQDLLGGEGRRLVSREVLEFRDSVSRILLGGHVADDLVESKAWWNRVKGVTAVRGWV